MNQHPWFLLVCLVKKNCLVFLVGSKLKTPHEKLLEPGGRPWVEITSDIHMGASQSSNSVS